MNIDKKAKVLLSKGEGAVFSFFLSYYIRQIRKMRNGAISSFLKMERNSSALYKAIMASAAQEEKSNMSCAMTDALDEAKKFLFSEIPNKWDLAEDFDYDWGSSQDHIVAIKRYDDDVCLNIILNMEEGEIEMWYRDALGQDVDASKHGSLAQTLEGITLVVEAFNKICPEKETLYCSVYEDNRSHKRNRVYRRYGFVDAQEEGYDLKVNVREFLTFINGKPS